MNGNEMAAIFIICSTVAGGVGIICYATWKLLTDKMFLIFLDSVLKAKEGEHE